MLRLEGVNGHYESERFAEGKLRATYVQKGNVLGSGPCWARHATLGLGYWLLPGVMFSLMV